MPIVPNTTPENRRMNRRTELVIVERAEPPLSRPTPDGAPADP